MQDEKGSWPTRCNPRTACYHGCVRKQLEESGNPVAKFLLDRGPKPADCRNRETW